MHVVLFESLWNFAHIVWTHLCRSSKKYWTGWCDNCDCERWSVRKFYANDTNSFKLHCDGQR